MNRVKDFKALLSAAKKERDIAILWLLYSCDMQRDEISRLNFEDLDIEAKTISVSGGRQPGRDRLVKLNFRPLESIRNWISVRGSENGALFTSMDRAKKGSGRLSTDGIYGIVCDIGKIVGLDINPQSVRMCGRKTEAEFSSEESDIEFHDLERIETNSLRKIKTWISEILSERRDSGRDEYIQCMQCENTFKQSGKHSMYCGYECRIVAQSEQAAARMKRLKRTNPKLYKARKESITRSCQKSRARTNKILESEVAIDIARKAANASH